MFGNGYQEEGEEAVTTLGVKHRLRHMDMQGVPNVTEILGGYHRLSSPSILLFTGKWIADTRNTQLSPGSGS